MGTWNTKPFGNDTACDWLYTLEEAMEETVFQIALGAEADGDETIAAAAVIEAARRQPPGTLPPKAKAWVSEQGFVPNDALVKQAIAAVEKITNDSELRELWAESDSLKSWLKQMDSLLAGLREDLSKPPPVRLPKAPPTPRKLEKIIERINPGEESPLRETMRKKLEAITDLEAPVVKSLFPEPPLTLLAKQGLLPEARRLVERGAKVNPEKKGHFEFLTPLTAACKHGHADMVKWLLEQGAKNSRGALYFAIKSGSIATIEVLLQHDAQLATSTPVTENGKYGKIEYWHDTVLHKAVEANQPHVIEFFVKTGVDLESKDSLGRTALIAAADQASEKDRLHVITKLLSLGANPNAKDNQGCTALDSVHDSNPNIAELIKKHGGRLGKDVSL